MDVNQQLAVAFEEVITNFNNSPGVRRLRNGNLSKAHYAAMLREIYFYTRENPQLQAAATLFFQGRQREMVKGFLRHSIAEIGHDQLALNDMAAMGFDTDGIKEGRALPATIALTSFSYYQISCKNAVGYLGYLYFLEFMPVRFGADYIDWLTKLQVPLEATSFLRDHSVIDVGHTQAMTTYADVLTTCQSDIDEVIYAMRVTGELYSTFVERTFESADVKGQPGANYGTDQAETNNVNTQRATQQRATSDNASAQQENAVAA